MAPASSTSSRGAVRIPAAASSAWTSSGPWYDHSLAGQYGIATPNGRFSDFFSFRSTRSAPQYAPYNVSVSDLAQYYGTSFNYDDDVFNNFYYRFGKNNSQQIQVLTDWIDHRAWANAGGLTRSQTTTVRSVFASELHDRLQRAAMFPSE